MVEHAPDIWRSTIRRRTGVLAVVLLVWSTAIAGAAVRLQVFQHEKMKEHARGQQLQRRPIPAKRGAIVDRNGVLLGSTVTEHTLMASPGNVSDVKDTVAQLCRALQDCTPEVSADLGKILSSRKSYTPLRQVTAEQARRINELKARSKLPGMRVELESHRSYPNLQLAAHVLGAVGDKEKEKPLGGIELSYDRILRGRDGSEIWHLDSERRIVSSRSETAAVSGTSLELTIDINLQNALERELFNGVRENRAEGGTALVMDPFTGEILAFASYPTFDPNPPRRVREIASPAVVGYFEPGSALKAFIAAAALEERVVTADEVIDVSDGRVVFGPHNEIRDIHRYGKLRFVDVIAKSSNVGTYEVARRMKRDRLVDYFRLFGFGRRTSGAFPGETSGRIPSVAELRSEGAVARAAIGYSVGVTHLQLAAALSSIANGGELLQPRIVRAFFNDTMRQATERFVVNRTVSRESSLKTTRILEEVVESGTGTPARIPGYTVAGKTGTAEKLTGGRYSETDHNVSFIGFVPSRERPRFTIVVSIDSPKGPNGHYAGAVAGPVFRHIAESALRLAGIPPTINPPTPVLVQRRPDGPNEQPASGPLAPPASLTPVDHRRTTDGVMPDVIGLSSREALSVMSKVGLTVTLEGSGTVITQRPLPGAPLGRRVEASLQLSRSAPVRAGDDRR